MKRQIKVRAWDGKKMIYRTLFDRNWYATPENDENGCHCLRTAMPSDRNLLETMEFTGLKDKNGKEIYEGDIVENKHSEQGKQDEFYLQRNCVSFHNGGFGFESWYTDEKGNLKEKLIHHPAHHVTRDLYYIEFDIEIKGNLHENPELLNNKQ